METEKRREIDGIESEREREKEAQRGDGGKGGFSVYASVYGYLCMCVYATRCIGLAGREWRRRREKEEKDRAVKLVCRSVTA